MAYDPRSGPPTYPDTAATQEEFEQQADIYRQFLLQNGVVADQGGGALGNTGTYTPTGPTPQQQYADMPWTPPPTSTTVTGGGTTPPPGGTTTPPPGGTTTTTAGGVDTSRYAAMPGYGTSWGLGWNDGTPEGLAAYQAAGSPAWDAAGVYKDPSPFAGMAGYGTSWGNGWFDGTPEGTAAWQAAGRPDWQGKRYGEPGYDPNTGSGTLQNGSPSWDPYGWYQQQNIPEDQRDWLYKQAGTVAVPRTFAPNLTGINPNDNLRSQQINPELSPLVSQLEGQAGALAQNLSGTKLPAFQGVNVPGSANDPYANEAAGLVRGANLGEFGPLDPSDLSKAYAAIQAAQGEVGGAGGMTNNYAVNAGTYQTSDAAKRAREIAQQGLENLQGPDRLQLAIDAFNRYRQEREPQFQQDVRKVGQSAASFGRIGAGMTTNELTDLSTQRSRDEDIRRRELIDDAVSRTLGDRQSNLAAALSAGGQFRAEDLGEAGFQQGLRSEQRGERGAQNDIQYNNALLALQRAGALRGLGGDLAGLATTQRGEAERDRAFGADQAYRGANFDLSRAGALAGLGADQFSREQSLRGEQRTERDAQQAQALSQYGLDERSLQALLGTSSQFFGQDQSMRDELRGERSWQDQLANEAMDRQVQQALYEEQFSGNAFERELEKARLLREIAAMGYGSLDATPELRFRAAGT